MDGSPTSNGLIERHSTAHEEQALAMRIQLGMESRLRANRDQKSHWLDSSFDFLFQRLDEEIEEFKQAVGEALEQGVDQETVWGEAADISNFLAMISDKAVGHR